MKNSHPTRNKFYNHNLKNNANRLRKNMTKAEACAWKYILSAAQMKGYLFNRQRPVLQYIADFLCKEISLIIEIDGITHHDEKVMINDQQRQEALEKAGFRVIRFSDHEVLKHIRSVRETIEDVISEIERGKIN